MPDLEPILLLTRPRGDSEAFARDLGRSALISPVLVIEPVGDVGEVPADGGLILTSRHGVAQLPNGSGSAYCVGDATAAAAAAKGYAPISCGGDAEALVETVLAEKPPGIWVHIRGEKSRGDIAARLTDGGVNCRERIVYRTRPQPLSPEAREALGSERGVILPLFSPFSAQVVMKDVPKSAQVTFLAISEAVAGEIGNTFAQKIIVAAQPTRTAMIAATEAAFERRAFSLRASGGQAT